MTSYIFNPFSPPPVNPKSHVRGWAIHWSESVGATIADKKTDLSSASVLYLDHGVNFSGGLNLFGGVTEEVFDRLEQLSRFTGRLGSLDLPMPNYAEQLQKRIGQATCDSRLASILPALTERFADTEYITQAHLDWLPNLTIGDSHSTSMAPASSRVLRTNGQTLFGALRDNLIEAQLELCTNLDSVKNITLAYGSIDIRHHIGRQTDPESAVRKLAENYADRIKTLSSVTGISVEAAAPVPVEHEGRKLPQTGYYKGTPFAGTQAQRRAWTEIFKNVLIDSGINLASPPQEWYTMDGELFAKNCMELGSSVHLAPTHYRRYNWGSV